MGFCVGLDLGKEKDYAALAVVEESGPGEDLLLRHLERYPLGTPYAEVARRVAALVRDPRLSGGAELVVDATGVGGAVTEILAAEGLPFTGVTITSGKKERNAVERGWRVPKTALVSALDVALSSGRLKVAGGGAGLVLWPALKEELLNFRRKISARTARVSFEHRSDGEHDDLVLATALACWLAKAGEDRL